SADDVQDANNTDTPWVDQSQTYTSHSSHQVFVREYVMNAAGQPVSTGSLLTGPVGSLNFGGQATWADVKAQASTKLGLWLQDKDVTNVPMLATDPYGKFLPGPLRGMPQYVTKTGLVEGDPAANGGRGVAVPATVRYFDPPFLTDLAHNADPHCPDITDQNSCKPADGDTTAQPPLPVRDPTVPGGDPTYDNELLDAHAIAGDGRVNENIALTTVHQMFHSEHNRLVGYIKGVLLDDAGKNA